MRRIASAALIAAGLLGSCAQREGASECEALAERVAAIEAEAKELYDSFDSALRIQELQTEITQVRREMATAGCS